jgi:hypothetical protein
MGRASGAADVGAATAAAAGNPQAQITLDAASSVVNGKTGTVSFIGTASRPVVLSQGNTRVRADRANTTCLKQEQPGAAAVTRCANSRWTFQGNVQIEAPPRGSFGTTASRARRSRVIRRNSSSSAPMRWE